MIAAGFEPPSQRPKSGLKKLFKKRLTAKGKRVEYAALTKQTVKCSLTIYQAICVGTPLIVVSIQNDIYLNVTK
ncbi:hypothetical protein GCM10007895_29300 [Paraferrimonas sedimenticola]|uniref:Uncharacterized protein n=1 Tax=Paraferrimonas sedimenticola TaxID=375674 RepID=A0AA37RYF3_9GAMM|nr:hypothetical protein GCM10007895_29300 [Paraferrimonas sedimenticola]